MPSLLDRFRAVLRVTASPDEFEFAIGGEAPVHLRPTICLEPQSLKISGIGEEACREPGGLFVQLFPADLPPQQELRAVALARFCAYGSLLARERFYFLRPVAVVRGLRAFAPRDRERVREELAVALRTPWARVYDVSFTE